MKINLVLKLALQNLLKNKKRNSIILLPLIIITILILFAITIQYSMQQYIKSIEDNIEMRELGITYTPNTYEEIMEKLSKIEHIAMIVDQYESYVSAILSSKQFSNSVTDGSLYEKPANNKTCPEVIQGRKIEDNDSNVIVIPSKLYCDSNYRNFNNPISEDEYIDGTSLIGTTIDIEIFRDPQTILYKTFKVIGVYDSDRYLSNKIIYMPKSAIREINTELKIEYTEYHMCIIVDKLENITKVQDSLIENHLLSTSEIEAEASNANPSGIEESNFAQTTNISIQTQKIIKNTMYILIILSILILFIMILITNINKSYISSTELGILKIIGYKNKDIQKITILENVFICILSILIGLVIFKILQYLGNLFINWIIQIDTPGITFNKIQEQLLYISKIPQKVDIKSLTFFSIIVILFEIVNTYFINKKFLSKKITNLLRQ